MWLPANGLKLVVVLFFSLSSASALCGSRRCPNPTDQSCFFLLLLSLFSGVVVSRCRTVVPTLGFLFFNIIGSSTAWFILKKGNKKETSLERCCATRRKKIAAARDESRSDTYRYQ